MFFLYFVWSVNLVFFSEEILMIIVNCRKLEYSKLFNCFKIFDLLKVVDLW